MSTCQGVRTSIRVTQIQAWWEADWKPLCSSGGILDNWNVNTSDHKNNITTTLFPIYICEEIWLTGKH